jgi:hypothetical protein
MTGLMIKGLSLGNAIILTVGIADGLGALEHVTYEKVNKCSEAAAEQQ